MAFKISWDVNDEVQAKAAAIMRERSLLEGMQIEADEPGCTLFVASKSAAPALLAFHLRKVQVTVNAILFLVG